MHIAQFSLQGTFAVLNYILSSKLCIEIGLPFPVVYLRKHKLTKLWYRIHLPFICQILWQEWGVQGQININSPSLSEQCHRVQKESTLHWAAWTGSGRACAVSRRMVGEEPGRWLANQR